MKNYSLVAASILSVSLLFGASAANAKSPLEQCYDSTEGQPRTSLQSCLNKMLNSSEKTLNESYAKNKAELEDIDSSSTKKALESLKISQESFEKFRDDECQRRSDAMMGGSGSGDELVSCKIEINSWQAKNL
ncbi:upregulator of flagellar master operon [Proteus vulgaris]|uniref:lysozyme inhibitor LprI family protein n=1 Tax=Proteus vulgaris TaxID=585 RepID=UPI000E023E8A|nr:lysozyme inhibitor LprI family protein [Proteus vulgaris]SUC00349.1 upregulator of flagellar master operon [Proteus vulgaris]